MRTPPPKAFGADNVIKPGMWIIHYKGHVSPPTPGTYRFWGFSDDLIAVAVNGKTELVSFFTIWKAPPQVYTKTDPPGEKAADGTLVAGDWFTVGANDVVDLDVLIGERPGGTFNAFLMIERKGETYQAGRAGCDGGQRRLRRRCLGDKPERANPADFPGRALRHAQTKRRQHGTQICDGFIRRGNVFSEKGP